MVRTTTSTTDGRPDDYQPEPSLTNWVLAGVGALMAAFATTYHMTVTDTDHVYARDFVLVHRPDERVTGEVLHVHEQTNSLAVRVYRDGQPTPEVLTTPAELVDLHPAGRPLADDEEWDDGTEWEFDIDPDDFDSDDDDTEDDY